MIVGITLVWISSAIKSIFVYLMTNDVPFHLHCALHIREILSNNQLKKDNKQKTGNI